MKYLNGVRIDEIKQIRMFIRIIGSNEILITIDETIDTIDGTNPVKEALRLFLPLR